MAWRVLREFDGLTITDSSWGGSTVDMGLDVVLNEAAFPETVALCEGGAGTPLMPVGVYGPMTLLHDLEGTDAAGHFSCRVVGSAGSRISALAGAGFNIVAPALTLFAGQQVVAVPSQPASWIEIGVEAALAAADPLVVRGCELGAAVPLTPVGRWRDVALMVSSTGIIWGSRGPRYGGLANDLGALIKRLASEPVPDGCLPLIAAS